MSRLEEVGARSGQLKSIAARVNRAEGRSARGSGRRTRIVSSSGATSRSVDRADVPLGTVASSCRRCRSGAWFFSLEPGNS